MSVHVKNCAAETPARDQSLVAGGLKESHVAIGKLRRVGRGNLAVHRHVVVARTPTVAEMGYPICFYILRSKINS